MYKCQQESFTFVALICCIDFLVCLCNTIGWKIFVCKNFCLLNFFLSFYFVTRAHRQKFNTLKINSHDNHRARGCVCIRVSVWHMRRWGAFRKSCVLENIMSTMSSRRIVESCLMKSWSSVLPNLHERLLEVGWI